MGFNTNFDTSLPPWNGRGVCMTLNHEEVLHVLAETTIVIENYVPAPEYSYSPVPPDNEYIVPRYNERDWTKAINGETYAVIKGYDPEVHTLGIAASGIVLPVEESEVE